MSWGLHVSRKWLLINRFNHPTTNQWFSSSWHSISWLFRAYLHFLTLFWPHKPWFPSIITSKHTTWVTFVVVVIIINHQDFQSSVDRSTPVSTGREVSHWEQLQSINSFDTEWVPSIHSFSSLTDDIQLHPHFLHHLHLYLHHLRYLNFHLHHHLLFLSINSNWWSFGYSAQLASGKQSGINHFNHSTNAALHKRGDSQSSRVNPSAYLGLVRSSINQAIHWP